MSIKYLGYDLQSLIEKEKYINRLPAKKRMFVELFTTLHSISKVAKTMKIKPYICYRYLEDEKVQNAIQYMQEIIAFRNAVTQDYFVEKLKEIIESKDTKTKEKIDALGLLARITGHIKEKQENTATMVVLKQEGFVPTQETINVDLMEE